MNTLNPTYFGGNGFIYRDFFLRLLKSVVDRLSPHYGITYDDLDYIVINDANTDGRWRSFRGKPIINQPLLTISIFSENVEMPPEYQKRYTNILNQELKKNTQFVNRRAEVIYQSPYLFEEYFDIKKNIVVANPPVKRTAPIQQRAPQRVQSESYVPTHSQPVEASLYEPFESQKPIKSTVYFIRNPLQSDNPLGVIANEISDIVQYSKNELWNWQKLFDIPLIKPKDQAQLKKSFKQS